MAELLEFYTPLSNLITHQKGTYCCGIKMFNNLASDIKKNRLTVLNNLYWP